MARGFKTGGNNFKEGNPGGGRKKGSYSVPPEVKKMNRIEVERLLSKYLHKTATEIQEIQKDTTTESIDLMIIRVITEAIKRGDQNRLAFILDRLIGKVTDKIDLSGGLNLSHISLLEKLKDE